MPGHVKTDLLTFRASSSPYPTESGVTAAVTLFSKGDNFLYYVDDGGTERQIQVAAGGALTDIPLTANTASAFDVHQGSDSYFSADTTTGSEVVAMGNAGGAGLTARIHSNIIDLNASNNGIPRKFVRRLTKTVEKWCPKPFSLDLRYNQDD